MSGGVVPFVDEAVAPAVRAMLHAPTQVATGDALVLAHGAGSDREAPVLVAVAAAFAARGLAVLRCDLPFRQERRHGPPARDSGPRDRAGLAHALAAARALVPGRVFVGGHSYGGRQSSMLVAEDTELAAGLLLLAYPLHPPRRPAAERTAHFPAIAAPTLFVHGSRDPFGSPDALRRAIGMIPGATSLDIVEGVGHALAPARGGGASVLASRVATAFLRLVG